MKRIYAFLCVFCLLFCCTSIPVSTDQNPTLLVGEIVFSSNNYKSHNGISFVGITTENIKIFIRNAETKEIISTITDKAGSFFMNLQDGKYEIRELYLEKTRSNDGSWAYVYVNPSNKIVEIIKGLKRECKNLPRGIHLIM